MTATVIPTKSTLPVKHLLDLPRLTTFIGTNNGGVDTTTFAANDFDIDNRTGFMPPQAPISHLPSFWNIWEDVLQDAQSQGLKLGETPGLPEHERIKSEKWRSKVNNVRVFSFSSRLLITMI